jgi:hypothetical protein
MGYTTVMETVLNEANYKTKKDGFEEEGFFSEISFDGRSTEIFFVPKTQTVTKQDGTTVEFPGKVWVFQNEKPTYLYETKSRATFYRKESKPTGWMNASIWRVQIAPEEWKGMYAINFTPVPSESKVGAWKVSVTRNDDVYDIYLKQKNETASEEEKEKEKDEVF